MLSLFAKEWSKAIMPHALSIVCLKKTTSGLTFCSSLVNRASSSSLNSRYFSVNGKRKMMATQGRGIIASNSGSKPVANRPCLAIASAKRVRKKLTINVSVAPRRINAIGMGNLHDCVSTFVHSLRKRTTTLALFHTYTMRENARDSSALCHA